MSKPWYSERQFQITFALVHLVGFLTTTAVAVALGYLNLRAVGYHWRKQ